MAGDKTRLSGSALSRLQEVVGRDGVLSNTAELDAYVIDWRRNFSGPTDAVLLPRSTEQVAQIMRLCTDMNLPMIPQGGNTGQSGACVPLKDQGCNVIINMSKMNRIRAVDCANQSVTVDAGVVLQTIQECAKSNGLFFPLSLGAEGTCQIGGNLATNAGGTAVLRYGNARDMVLGLEVVLPNGDVWDGLRALRKDNTGYDLKALFMGSEGTLGIITGASLKLFAQPVEKAVAWVAMPSLQHATDLLSRFRVEFESRLSAFEYVSREQLDLVLRYVPGHTDPLPDKSAGYLLVELSDTITTGTLDALLQQSLVKAMEVGQVNNALVAASHAHALSFWKIRHSVSQANRSHGVSLNHDVAVPTSLVPAFVKSATSKIKEVFPDAHIVTVAHLGDGNVHFLTIFPQAFWDTLGDSKAYAKQVRQLVYDTSMEFQGTFSAEHGIGQSLTTELVRYKSSIEVGLMHQIKKAFDPLGIMNPNKVLTRPQPPSAGGICQ